MSKLMHIMLITTSTLTLADVAAPWTDWHVLSQPGNKAKVLALAAHPDGRMHAVMAGLDDQVWHNESHLQTKLNVTLRPQQTNMWC